MATPVACGWVGAVPEKVTRVFKKLKSAEKVMVAKASDGQRYPLPLCEYLWMCDGERGSDPEGADDVYIYCLALSGVSSLKKGSLVLIEDPGP